jgi:hypothetical protein
MLTDIMSVEDGPFSGEAFAFCVGSVRQESKVRCGLRARIAAAQSFDVGIFPAHFASLRTGVLAERGRSVSDNRHPRIRVAAQRL